MAYTQKYRKSIRRPIWLMFFTLLFFCFVTPSFGLDVTLSWNASAGASGCKIYYDSDHLASGPPYPGTGAYEGPSPIDVGNTTQFTAHDLPDSGCRFSLTAYNDYGESGFSADAVLLPQHTLSVSTVGRGSVNPSGGDYSENTAVQLTAVPDAGWVFSGWSGDLNATSNPATLIMDSDKSVTGMFTQLPNMYNLSVSTAGQGSVNPSGGDYSENSAVQLTAVPDAGWVFSGWSGDLNATSNPATLIMDSNKSVSAMFTQIPPQYTLTVITSGQGSVSPSSGTYESGAAVTLSATAAQGWQFSGWSGDLNGSSNPQSIIMDSDRHVVAKFEQFMPIIKVFTVTQENIGEGDPATLIWEITQADTATIDNGVGSVDPIGGSVEVTPTSTTTYTLTATNAAGSISATVTVLKVPQAEVLIFTEDFESGTLIECWEPHSSGAGRITVTNSGDPHSGDYHLTMDSSRRRTYSLNELILTIDLSGLSRVILSFYHKEFRDEDHVMPDSFTGNHNSDGVAISADGSTWYKIQGLTSKDQISSEWRKYDVDLDAEVTAVGIDYNSSFQIKFQQYDNYPIDIDGFALDDIEVYQRNVDSDSDGLPDDWEISYFNNLMQGPSDDCDSDGLNNLSEYQMGTKPCNVDSDADGMLDLWEVLFGLDPNEAADADEDLDNDGLTNLEEHMAGTDPTQAPKEPPIFPFTEDFESGTLSECWEIRSSGAGRASVTTSGDPHSGDYHLTMDSSRRGTYSLNELILTIDLSGQWGVTLSFYHKEFRDEDHVMPDCFTGSHNSDGVAISADGTTWHKVQGLTGKDRISSEWRKYDVDLDSEVAAVGIDYNSAFKIKLQQYDNYQIRFDGFALDDVFINVQSK